MTGFTCSPSQRSTSSTRQRSRFVPGKRQTGGKDCGFLVASLRILATDLRRHAASWSTVRSACMKIGPLLCHVTFVPKAALICAHPRTGSTSQSRPFAGLIEDSRSATCLGAGATSSLTTYRPPALVSEPPRQAHTSLPRTARAPPRPPALFGWQPGYLHQLSAGTTTLAAAAVHAH